MAVYNPQEGRLKTIGAVITDKNDTWLLNTWLMRIFE